MSTGRFPLHLLIGKERFLKREFIDDLRRRLFPDDQGVSMNFQEFSAEEHEVSAIGDFLSTAPFAADRRMAVVWGVDAFDKEERESFRNVLSKLPSTAVLVAESEQTNAKKDELLKELAEDGQLTACHAPFERDLPGWAQARARKASLTIEPKAVLYLIGCSGGELSTLASNIVQVASYVHPRTQVALADVEALFHRKAEDDVFRLADLLLEQKRGEALRVLDELLKEGARAPEIVGALAGQMERWKKANTRLAEGRSLEDVGTELRIPSYFQAAFFTKLKRMTQARLSGVAKALLACDEDFKTGRLPERLALEKFIWSS